MSAHSTLDPDAFPAAGPIRPPGHDVGSLGPSDLSDTGADSRGAGAYGAAVLGSDGDSVGTGVDPTVSRRSDDRVGADIGFDRVVGPGEAGLGRGLDQAEEARLGETDEARAGPDGIGDGIEMPHDPLDPDDPDVPDEPEEPVDPDDPDDPDAR
jgi:hypothetical protein